MRAYDEPLLDKPSIIPEDGTCAICGRMAENRHHIIPKGMGGRSKAIEKRIPLIAVCGFGNNSGCHGKLHSGLLHLRWEDGWQVKETPEPTKRINALMDPEGWKPLRGWRDG